MANLFDVYKVFRPGTTILSDDFNSFQSALVGAFQKLGTTRADNLTGVEEPFSVGTPTAATHAVRKDYYESSVISLSAAAVAGELASQVAAADGSATASANSATASASSAADSLGYFQSAQALDTIMPSGTTNSTMRYNGTNWEETDKITVSSSGKVKLEGIVARDIGDVFRGKSQGDPIVMTWVGNSNTGGFLTKAPTPALVANPNVLVWQAAGTESQTCQWSTADHDVSNAITVTGFNRMVGYCKGQRGSPALAAANELQRIYGCTVFLIMTFQGGAPSALVNPGLTDSTFGTVEPNADSIYDFSGGYGTSNNNLWFWHSTAVNSALASIRGDVGAVALPSGISTYATTYVDFVGDTLGQGDALYTSFYGDSLYTIPSAEVNYITNMTAFTHAAEGTTPDPTNADLNNGKVVAIPNGGWAKNQYTHWFSMDTPAGSEGGGGIGEAFANFDGLMKYQRVAKSLYRSVGVPNGRKVPFLNGTSLPVDETVYGTQDHVHPNTISNIAIGTSAARICAETPNSAPKGVDTTLNKFTENVAGSGFNLTGVGDLSATGTTTLTVAAGTIAAPATSAYVITDSSGNISQGNSVVPAGPFNLSQKATITTTLDGSGNHEPKTAMTFSWLNNQTNTLKYAGEFTILTTGVLVLSGINYPYSSMCKYFVSFGPLPSLFSTSHFISEIIGKTDATPPSLANYDYLYPTLTLDGSGYLAWVAAPQTATVNFILTNGSTTGATDHVQTHVCTYQYADIG